MLHALFGNKNLERILLFLFVNEKCYATQLKTLLQVPLAPIQNGLARLVQAGIIAGQWEGKNRVYRFVLSYPLLPELEALLKKSYSLLPVAEKKRYCFIHKPRLKLEEERVRDRQGRKELLAFWERLSSVRTLIFSVNARGEQKILKTGHADVSVTPTGSILIFQEKGIWTEDGAHFSGSFRWTLDLGQGLISLEHLRYGADRPVFLFHLSPTKPGVLESVDSHLCAEDTYLGNIIWDAKRVDFHWKIIGPRKNDELVYYYQ